LAAASSIAISLALRRLFAARVSNVTGAKGYIYNTTSSMIACQAAGFLNAWCMRQSELQKGVSVLHPETHQSYGLSKVCAHQAVLQTAISRVLLNIRVVIPAFVMYWIEKKRLMPKNQVLVRSLEFSLLAFELYLCVPIGIALYPRYG